MDDAGAGTVASDLCQLQLAGLGVIIKNLGIAPPLDGGFQFCSEIPESSTCLDCRAREQDGLSEFVFPKTLESTLARL